MQHGPLGEFAKTAEAASKAIALIEETGRQSDSFTWGTNVYGMLLAMHGTATATLGDFPRGEALCQKGLRFATEIKDLYCIGLVECSYATVWWMKGDGRKTIAHAENSLKYLEETQFLSLLSYARYVLGMGYCLLGETEAAREHVEKARETERAVGISLYPSMHYACMTTIHIERGDWESAQRNAREGLESAATHGERHLECTLSVALGTTLAKANPSQVGRGEEHVLRGIKIAHALKVRLAEAEGYLGLGELYADAGWREKALKAFRKAKRMFKAMGMDYYVVRTEKALEKLKG